MTDQSPANDDANDDGTAISEPAPNPRRYYDTPQALLDDASLGPDEKYALLGAWAADIDDRLKAEEEGMSASNPISPRHEARLADEAAQVSSALSTFNTPPGQNQT